MSKIYFYNGVDKVVRLDGAKSKTKTPKAKFALQGKATFKAGPGPYDITTKDGKVITLNPED